MSGEVILTAGKALLFFAVPLGLGLFELWRLRREQAREREAAARGGAGHEGERPEAGDS